LSAAGKKDKSRLVLKRGDLMPQNGWIWVVESRGEEEAEEAYYNQGDWDIKAGRAKQGKPHGVEGGPDQPTRCRGKNLGKLLEQS